MRFAAAVVVCFVSLTSCQRERREVRPSPTRTVVFGDAARQSTLVPGGSHGPAVVVNPSNGNAYDISEGHRLYNWYNCSGCHFNGGGGIGPPLVKSEWIYGGEAANLFDTIVKGRPNGMPAWGGKIPEYQIWQIVAYIRSMNAEQPSSATPVRSDNMTPLSESVRPASGAER